MGFKVGVFRGCANSCLCDWRGSGVLTELGYSCGCVGNCGRRDGLQTACTCDWP